MTWIRIRRNDMDQDEKHQLINIKQMTALHLLNWIIICVQGEVKSRSWAQVVNPNPQVNIWYFPKIYNSRYLWHVKCLLALVVIIVAMGTWNIRLGGVYISMVV